MKPTITLDRTLVAVNVYGIVHLLLELAAPAAVAAARPPIDAVVVLDRSGSMDGAPLEAVKEATANLLRLLGPDDRLGVVTFDDEVDLVLPLAHHDLHLVSAQLRGIRSGGSTNLSGGWLKAMEILAALGRTDALRRIMVLTDGHANAGIIDPARLRDLAKAAHSQRISTSMIGFDDGYDEVLLASMADAGGGNDYWCAGPDQTAAVFAAEFEGLASVVAQNISVEIRPAEGVEPAVLNDAPITIVPGGLQIALGDAYGGEQRRVVAMLRIGTPTVVGPVQLGEIVIRWASTVGDVELHTVTIPVTINATDDPDAADRATDATVIEHVNVLRAAQERRTAHDRIANGDVDGAAAALSRTIDLLAPLPACAAEVQQARFDLEELQHGAWTAASSKRLFSTQRSTEKGRRSRFDQDPGEPSGPPSPRRPRAR